MDTPRSFYLHVYKGDNFCDCLFASLYTQALPLKGAYSNRKEFSPSGAFFSYNISYNWQGSKNFFKSVASLASVNIILESSVF